ncbi:MAG: phosphoserine transaminase [Hyphomicrobium sp.]|nr:phosphoserine transaminase [Hyphomicrobium sp.]
MPLPPRPNRKPRRPFFSSGPTAKPPGWSTAWLDGAFIGRSHRAPEGRVRLEAVIDETAELLELPRDYRLAIVPGSDTGAFEMALWNLLGPRGVDVLAWEVFGKTWVRDVVEELKPGDVRVRDAPFGHLPDLSETDPARDIVLTANGTTSGVRIPGYDWIAADRDGLTIVDATSAIFAHRVDWPKVDALTFSWQKALGGEAAHGMLVLSPRAVERAETARHKWPMPKLFRMVSDGGLDETLFRGVTINTPSMLAVEDWARCLAWARSVGGPAGLRARAEANAGLVYRWADASRWATPMAADPTTRSLTSICLSLDDARTRVLDATAQWGIVAEICHLLEREHVAFDIAAHRHAPPGLRIWTGPTVEIGDIEALLPWLDWAFASVSSSI